MLAVAQAETGVPHRLGYRIAIRPASAIGLDDSGLDCSGVVAGVVERHGGLRWGVSVGLPVGVAEGSLIAEGDQGDDDEGAAHGWSPLGAVD